MILVIDDDPEVLDILKDSLKEIGDEQVICCESMPNALDIIKTVPGISSIYLDVYLPGVNGADSILQVSRLVQELNLDPKPMIKAMSGDTRKEVKDQSIVNGARTFLDKSQLITSQDALRQSYFLEERRSRDNEVKERLARIETQLWEVNKAVSNLQGQETNDDQRITEIQTQVFVNTEIIKPITNTVGLIKKFPFGLKGFLVITFLLLSFASSLFSDMGLPDKFMEYFYNQMPERPSKTSKTP
jgi:CheY-like chemotaxis protein